MEGGTGDEGFSLSASWYREQTHRSAHSRGSHSRCSANRDIAGAVVSYGPFVAAMKQPDGHAQPKYVKVSRCLWFEFCSLALVLLSLRSRKHRSCQESIA